VATVAIVEDAFWVHSGVKTVGAEVSSFNDEKKKLSEDEFFLNRILEDKAINLYLNKNLTYDVTLGNNTEAEMMLKEFFIQLGIQEKDYKIHLLS